ncbi:MAG: hypothetical protein AAGF54_19560 [Pseudomonadota bacterium]
MTFSAIPDGMRLTSTSQYLSLNLFMLTCRVKAWLACFCGLIFGFFGFYWVAIFLVLSGLVILYSQRKQKSRRFVVSDRYRVPSNLVLSERIIWSNWHGFRKLNMIVAVVPPVLLLGMEGWLGWIMAIVVVSFLTWPVSSAILSLIKYHYDQNFRIVLFRRNQSEIAEIHKSVIMPACGLYGQVLLIIDESLSAFQESMRDRMATWWLSEMYHPMIVTDDPDHWRQVVMIELAYADFAVLDWSGEVSGNMRWELNQALLMLPANRILMVGASEEELNNSVPSEIGGHPVFLKTAVAPAKGIERPLFLSDLSEAMRELQEEPRRPSAVARAWQFQSKIYLDKMDWSEVEAGTLDYLE